MRALDLDRNDTLLFPAVLGATVLGGLLVVAAGMGSKWLVLTGLAYLALAGLLVAPNKRVLAVCLLSACVPIGFQYNFWTSGNKFSFINHFGGALAEPVLNMVDVPILLLLVLWIVDLRAKARALPVWTGTDTLVAAMLGVSMLSLFNTEEHLLFAFEMIRYLKYLLLYWMLRTYLDSPPAFWGILGAQIGVLSVQGLVSLMQYFLFFQFPIPVGGVTGADVEMLDNEIIQRVTGVLGHSNTFSAYLSVACAFCLIVLFSRVRPLYRYAPLPFLLAGLLSLVLTFSRNGWMVFAFNAVLIGFWALRTRRLTVAALGGIAVLGLGLFAALVVSGVFDTMLSRVFHTQGKEFDSRWDLLVVAWEMIRTHPLLGIGLNSFEESMIRFDPRHITHVIRQPVHNGFVLVAAETGLPALAVLLALLVKHLAMAAKILRGKDELHFAVGLAGLATFGGLALANLFDVTLRKESVSGLIVVVAAMLASLWRMDAKRIGEERNGSLERNPTAAFSAGRSNGNVTRL